MNPALPDDLLTATLDGGELVLEQPEPVVEGLSETNLLLLRDVKRETHLTRATREASRGEEKQR